VCSRPFDEDDEEIPQEELSPFQLIEKAVDLALQAHGIWNIEVSETVGKIVQVAENLAKVEPGDLRKLTYDPRKIAAADRESLFKAIAIFKLVAGETFGLTRAQVQKKIDKYVEQFD